MLYTLAWKHKGTRADLEPQFVRDPVWFCYVTTLLFSALNRAGPHLFDKQRLAGVFRAEHRTPMCNPVGKRAAKHV